MLLDAIKKKIANLKSWQWFLLLYVVGFTTLVSASYGIKFLMTGLP